MALTKEQIQKKRELLLEKKELLQKQDVFRINVSDIRQPLFPGVSDVLTKGLREGGRSVQTEVLSPIASGLSTAAFGVPRALSRKFGAEEAIFPEPRTLQGKALKGAADIRGLFAGGAAKTARGAAELAGRAGAKIAPKLARRFGGDFAGQSAQAAVGGATFGATQLEPDATLKGQAEQAFTFGAFGGVIPSVLKAGKATAKLGEKFKSDFIQQNVVPRVERLFQGAFEKFPESLQRFAVNVQKAPANIVEHISKRTPSGIKNSIEKIKDSTDKIFLHMRGLFQGKGQDVTEAYRIALEGIPENGLIQTTESSLQLGRMLRKRDLVNKFGKPTKRALDPLTDPVLKTLVREFQTLAPEGGAETGGLLIINNKPVNKFVWEEIKDSLSQINARAGKLSPDITKILDVMHKEAEKAGAVGINQARVLAKNLFSHQSLADKFIGEKKLNNVFKFTGEESREFKRLEQYLNANFSTRAKDVISNTALQNIEKEGLSKGFGETSKLISGIEKSADLKRFQSIKDELQGLLGKSSELDAIFNDVKTFQRARVAKKIGAIGLRFGVGASLGLLGLNKLRSLGEDSEGGGGGF